MDIATHPSKAADTTGYIVRPNFEEKFRSTKVQEILYSCISEILGDKKFDQAECAEWTKAGARARLLLRHRPSSVSVCSDDQHSRSTQSGQYEIRSVQIHRSMRDRREQGTRGEVRLPMPMGFRYGRHG